MRYNLKYIGYTLPNKTTNAITARYGAYTYKFPTTKETIEEIGWMIDEVFVKQQYYSPYLEFLDNAIVIDVGMNRGIASLYFASMPQVAKVYGFEPLPEMVAYAEALFKQNPTWQNKITLYPHGWASSTREQTIQYAKKRPSTAVTMGGSKFLPLEEQQETRALLQSATQNLESIIHKHPNQPIILKIDTEGAEYEILQSIPQELLNKCAYIRGEFHKGFEPLYKILAKNFICECVTIEAGRLPQYNNDIMEIGIFSAFNKRWLKTLAK